MDCCVFPGSQARSSCRCNVLLLFFHLGSTVLSLCYRIRPARMHTVRCVFFVSFLGKHLYFSQRSHFVSVVVARYLGLCISLAFVSIW